MKIAIFHPLINYYGGGEMVALTIASMLSKNHEVEVLSSFPADKGELEDFFDLDLGNLSLKVRPFAKFVNALPFINSYKNSLEVLYLGDLDHYDLVIDTGTNGLFTKKLKSKTVCYVHFPFFQPKKKGWKKVLNFLLVDSKRAFNYDKIVCNSSFTKKYVQTLTRKQIHIVNPPVKVSQIRHSNKKNFIVTVGRFTREKKHEIMIEAFKKLNPIDWEFHLIGSFQENVSLYDKEYLDKLKDMAKGFPISFHLNMPHNEVIKLLEQSKIYWHARGYRETSLNEYENFGISTVEAMAAGCVPVVINKGAQPEIVEHNKNGFVWKEPGELINYTAGLIANESKMKKLSKESIKKSKIYDIAIFEKKMKRLIESLS